MNDKIFTIVEASILRDAVEMFFESDTEFSTPYYKDYKEAIIKKIIDNTEVPKD